MNALYIYSFNHYNYFPFSQLSSISDGFPNLSTFSVFACVFLNEIQVYISNFPL